MHLSRCYVLFLLVAGASLSSDAQPTYVFETATSGPTGQTDGGLVVNQNQFVGAKFEITVRTQVTSLGAHLDGSLPGEIFIAIVPLDLETDLPATFDLSDAFFSETFLPPQPSSDEVTIGTSLILDPGRYGVVLGSGLFGATGTAVMPDKDEEVGEPEYFSSNISVPVWFDDDGIRYRRFFVLGSVLGFSDGFESGDTSAWSMTYPGGTGLGQ